MNNALIAGERRCGTCTLCCKIMSISELQKPQGIWCLHCDVGNSCKIYQNRPNECETFYCGWLETLEIPEHWFPARSKIVITSELDGNRLAFHVDPSRPDAWKKEPYYSEIKAYSINSRNNLFQVVVCIEKHIIVILPDRDVDLGIVAEDERIVTAEVMTKMGLRVEALKLKENDPRIVGRNNSGVTY